MKAPLQAEARAPSAAAATDVVMLLDNHCGPDRRVEYEVDLLESRGLRTSVVAWDRRTDGEARPGLTPFAEGVVRGWRVAVPAPPGGGPRSFRAMLSFAAIVLRRRAELVGRPGLLVGHDINLLPLVALLARAQRVPFVYDAHEEYSAMEGHRYPSWFTTAVEAIESRLARRASAVVVPGRSRVPRWTRAGLQSPVILPNFGRRSDPPPDRAAGPPRWDLVFCSGIDENKRIDVLLDAARLRSDVRIVFAGRGRLAGEVEQAAATLENVDYVGWEPNPDRLMAAGRAVMYALDPAHPYSDKVCSNTLYQALRVRRPVVFFSGGDLADAATRFRIGLRIAADPHAVIEAVDRLRATDPDSWQLDEARAALMGDEAAHGYVAAIQHAIALPARSLHAAADLDAA